jgi:hypothetical protein
MRTYIIILSEIKDQNSDTKFSEYVNKNKFDYWRYTALNWILLTPDSVTTNVLIAEITQAYGTIFQCVLEVSINDIGGIFPQNKYEGPQGWSPFNWFYEIKKPTFIPRWEK